MAEAHRGRVVAVLVGLAALGLVGVGLLRSSQPKSEPEPTPGLAPEALDALLPEPVVVPPRAMEGVADEVECVILNPRDLRGALYLSELDPETMEVVDVHLVARKADLITFGPADPEVGAGLLTGRGIESKPVVWAMGSCTSDVALQPTPRTDLTVIVEGAQDIEPGLISVLYVDFDEGGKPAGRWSVVVNGDGVAQVRQPVSGSCEVAAHRLHGSMRRMGPFVPCAADGQPEELVLEVPPPPRTGLGGYANGGGLRVDAVAPGSPAARAGIVVRDMVRHADGQGIEDVEDFVESVDLEVVVERDGTRFSARL